MCNGHTTIKTGKVRYKYCSDGGDETVEFTEKDMSLELTCQLAKVLQDKHIDPNNIKKIVDVSGGNHGGDVFQFGAKLTVHFNNKSKPVTVEVLACKVIY